MVTATTTASSLSGTGSTAAANTSSLNSTSAQETSDRFLKLLVAQLQNQDPLSPMDNAQVTSQMAQINTVTGISQLNTTMEGLTSQFTALQAMQGASLVGHEVLIEGNKLTMNEGSAEGAFELVGAADAVKVEVMSASGQVIDTLNLGAETSGKHTFTWAPATAPASTAGLTFKVTATAGTKAVASTALMADEVTAVSTSGTMLNLELKHNGTQPYSKVKTVS
jgi:flagellar basal-body rod modification protein FlgD